MSISYSAKIVVGLPFNEVFNTVGEFEKVAYGNDLLQSTELEIISPFYDAGLDDSLVGIVLVGTGSYNYKEIATNFETQATRKLFKEVTGKEARVYLSPCGY